MSWSPSVYIGEMRPWPDSVHVVRGKTDETRRYFPERTCRMERRDSETMHQPTVWLHCSECGDATLLMRSWSDVAHCPRCGARVVSNE